MFNIGDLILLAAALDPEGVIVQNRRQDGEQGWERVFDAVVKASHLSPVSAGVGEPGPGDHSLWSYQITPAARKAGL